MVRIRIATPDDAASISKVYEPYVLNTPVSFELDPPSPADFEAAIRNRLDEAGDKGEKR